MNGRNQFIFAFLVLSLLTLSLVVAANSNSNGRHDSNSSRMNYGLCVSNFTLVKNDCLKQAKNDRKDCDGAARNLTIRSDNRTLNLENRGIIRNQTRVCLNDYKVDVLECKDQFKIMKDSCGMYRCKANQTFVNSTCL